MSKTPPLVIIEWEDSRQPESSWRWLADFTPDDVCVCVSVGFLIYDGDTYKALAPNMTDVADSDGTQVSGVIHIPASCVTRIGMLTEKPRAKKRGLH